MKILRVNAEGDGFVDFEPESAFRNHLIQNIIYIDVTDTGSDDAIDLDGDLNDTEDEFNFDSNTYVIQRVPPCTEYVNGHMVLYNTGYDELQPDRVDPAELLMDMPHGMYPKYKFITPDGGFSGFMRCIDVIKGTEGII